MKEKFFNYLLDKIRDDSKIQTQDNKLILKEDNPRAELKELKIKINQSMKKSAFLIKSDIENLKHIGLLKDKFSVVDGILVVLKEDKIYMIHVELKSGTHNKYDVDKKYYFSESYMELIKNNYLKREVSNGKLDIIHRFVTFVHNKNSQKDNQTRLFEKESRIKVTANNNSEFNLNKFL